MAWLGVYNIRVARESLQSIWTSIKPSDPQNLMEFLQEI
jgi:hypothetical protein